MYRRIRTIIAGARLDSGGGYDSSGGGGTSSCSGSCSSGTDDSSSTDEFCLRYERRELRRHASPLPMVREDHEDSIDEVYVHSAGVLCDIHKHQRRMLPLLPAFAASPAVGAERTEALSCWLSGFEVGWVLDLDMDAASGSGSGGGESLLRMEFGPGRQLVSAWAQALSTMERVFRLQHRELTPPAQVTALEELAVAITGAMLKPVGAVAALESSPSKLLTVLDLCATVSETYPALARLFSWGPTHPLSIAAEATLAVLVDAALRCRHDLAAFIRSYYPWRKPEGSDVHPCVEFWMGYLLFLLRNRISFIFILGSDDEEAPRAARGGLGGVVAELISCLEAVLQEESAALHFPGLRQVFMLNNTYAIMRRAVDSDLEAFLPPDWSRAREKSVQGYIGGYIAASWTPVVSLLDTAGVMKFLISRRRNPLSAFYSAFDKACSAQRCWKVPKPALRRRLRETVSENVVSRYRRYLQDQPEAQLASGRTAEELEKQLADLFEG